MFGHTLDLDLSFGLPFRNLEICDTVFSDHIPVLFDIALACNTVKPCAGVHPCHIINSSTAVQFVSVFSQNCAIPESMCNDSEEFSSWFHSTCHTVIVKLIQVWILWKSGSQKLNLSHGWMTQYVLSDVSAVGLDTNGNRTNCMCHFKSLGTVGVIIIKLWKMLKWIISLKLFCRTVTSLVLFKTIDSVIHVPQTVCGDASSAVCENFLHFFIDKVTSTRALISPPSYDPSVSVLCSAVFDQFEPLTLSVLHEIVGHLKPSISLYDAVPPWIVKEVFPTVGPSALGVLHFLNMQ